MQGEVAVHGEAPGCRDPCPHHRAEQDIRRCQVQKACVCVHGLCSDKSSGPEPISSAPRASTTYLQASFQSVLDNAESPGVFKRPRQALPAARSSSKAERSKVDESFSSGQTPASTVRDSQSQNNVTIAAFTSPTRLLETYLQQFDSQSDGSRQLSDAKSSQSEGNSGVAMRVNPGTGKDGSNLEIVEVACTPKNGVQSLDVSAKRVTDLGSEARNTGMVSSISGALRQISSDDDIIEDTVLVSSPSRPISGQRGGSEPPLAKNVDENELGQSPRSLLRTTSDIGPRSAVRTPSFQVTFRSQEYSFDSLEIHSKQPPTSCDDLGPSSLVTPDLDKLASDLKIVQRFRPSLQTRELRPLERGYWKLDCDSWNDDLKLVVWAFLANYVGAGTAGWGVWCRRDDGYHWIRVYCWGIVAPHIYLLLYIATQREVLGTGSTWVDADGQAVIEMGKRTAE